MKKQIFKPNTNLATLVKCYWVLEGEKDETPQKNTIVPDGTIKMIFHCGDLYRHYPENKNIIILPRCFVIWQLTQPYVVEPIWETSTFIVRFQPNGFFPFSTIAIKEIENRAISLEELFWKEGKRIGKMIIDTSTTSERIELIEEFLLNYLTETKNIDNILKTVIETIVTAGGKLPIATLSKKSRINCRQLERKFSSTIGLSPKQFSKIIRLQSTLKSFLPKEDTNLTNLAYENEYYDQAHFIKEFKEFTGLTPKNFYGDDLKMSLIFDNKG